MIKIKAEHITSWNHPNCKFFPNDIVRLVNIDVHQKWAKPRIGLTGKVVAVTSSEGKIRGGNREITRYYVEFDDRRVAGFHSHFLTAI
jgi:hypothetical protein